MVATYNEMENLPDLVGQIFKFLPQADLLVIDDNSPDGTGKWCQEQQRLNKKINLIVRKEKLGLGTAIIAGMEYSIKNDYDYVINMDADFSHQSKDLPGMVLCMDLDKNEPKDVIIGSRYALGGKTDGWPIYRETMSRFICFYADYILGLGVKDCSGGFRCYRTSLLQKIDLKKVISKGYSFQEEILWRLKNVGAKFGETPITFVERKKGKSKINIGEALATVRIIFMLGFGILK